MYLYDTHGEPGGKLLQKFEHRAPVLDVCFGRDDNEAFTASLDWEVRRYNAAWSTSKASNLLRQN